MTACIVGWAHLPFGRREEEDVESLIMGVAGEAIADAGIGPDEIDSIHVGLFNSGFQKQDFPASLVLQADEALRFKPATRVENACATGSAAGVRARASEQRRRCKGDQGRIREPGSTRRHRGRCPSGNREAPSGTSVPTRRPHLRDTPSSTRA